MPGLQKVSYFRPSKRKCGITIVGKSMTDPTQAIPIEELVKRIARGEVVYNDNSVDLGDYIHDDDVKPENVHPLERRENDDISDIYYIKRQADEDLESFAKFSKSRVQAQPEPQPEPEKAKATDTHT